MGDLYIILVFLGISLNKNNETHFFYYYKIPWKCEEPP